MDTEAPYVAPRKCTVVDEGEETRRSTMSSVPLSDFADAAAYVLIAEPGAGKTTAFESEAQAQGGTYVTVRNFLAYDDKTEWHGTTLYLDGLDEFRVGKADGRPPLDRIRRKLYNLNYPPFRLSCRWADWMAANDKEALRDVSPDGTVAVIRLDPLSEQNIKEILSKNHGVEDSSGFIRAARDRGVSELLKNPQNLAMLAKSVSQGKWPASRKETFDQACRMLAHESNGEHRAANPSCVDATLLIEAAGRLCAAQVLSGTAGYTLPDRAGPDSEYPSFTDVYSGGGNVVARNVLGTRLFVGVSEGKLAPAHRQIGEFLAAQYVSSLLDTGFPLGRILALITGFDGELVPPFRNFASWLAVHNKASRKRLSELNPSGLIYAGDQETYSVDEKRDIVLNLRRECDWNPWCSRSVGMVSGIGRIVSPELEDTFQEILTDEERGRENQSYVMILMQMLADGDPLPGLSDLLEQMSRDHTWNQGVRCAALDVLTSYHARGSLGFAGLKGMVAEIADGSIDDPEDEMLGILLKALYPNVLSITEVQQYLRAPKLVTMTGEYSRFWTDHIPRESTTEQLADLLDGIAEQFADYRPFMGGRIGWNTGLGQLPMELLDRVLREDRHTAVKEGRHIISVDRLYEWLGVVSDPSLRMATWRTDSIKFDLRWDEDRLKALTAHGVETCLRRGEECRDVIDQRLFGACPRRYGQWCLEMALAAEEAGATDFYLEELLDCVNGEGDSDRLTLDEVRGLLAADEALLHHFNQMEARRPRIESETGRQTLPESAANMASEKDTEEQQSWQALIEAQASELRAGRGSPKLLYRAAEAYLGIEESLVEGTPRQRLGELVGSRVDLIDLLIVGMEGTIERKDLPDCDGVVRLFDQHRVNPLLLPFVAGLHSLEQSGQLSVANMTESQIHLAVTTIYTLPGALLDPDNADRNGVYRPAWFQTLLRDNPKLVAVILHRSAVRKLETGVQPATELHELANADDHREVAEFASLSMLEHFPTVETDEAVQSLCWGLHSALKVNDWSVVGRAIEERLGRGGYGVRERGCWITAGYLLDPERYREDLRGLAADEDGLKSLAMFMATGRFPRELIQRFSAGDLTPLVSALGTELDRVGLPEKAFWCAADLIAVLGDDPSAAATDTLEALSDISHAEPWEPAIASARERQARKRREREYRHNDTREVLQTLDQGAPANAGDLAELVYEELETLARKFRDGNTSDWRQCWNVDRYNRPLSPKPEDACRDALLSDLQERLGRFGIDAHPEGVYAEDNRSDIRVSFAGLNIPVEIKRSCHPNVWTAMWSQLIAKYTRDPGTAGYGIYLVLWFGNTEKCRPTKYDGWTPETAEGVKLRIQQSLDDRERHLISVCVLDVAAPR